MAGSIVDEGTAGEGGDTSNTIGKAHRNSATTTGRDIALEPTVFDGGLVFDAERGPIIAIVADETAVANSGCAVPRTEDPT